MKRSALQCLQASQYLCVKSTTFENQILRSFFLHSKSFVMAIKEGNITIMVKDMDRSISFYESIGLTLKNRWANYYAQLTAPGLTIGLHPGNDTTQQTKPDNISIGFTTDNFEEMQVLLQKLPVDITPRQEEGGSFLHFTDPDGTPLYFIKPKW